VCVPASARSGKGVVGGLEVCHDHGSQFVADKYSYSWGFHSHAEGEPAWLRRCDIIEELRLALYQFKDT
jgi:hypothetical protein